MPNYFFFYILMALLFGCSRTPEKQLTYLLKTKYANLYVNEDHKRKVIKELKLFLEKNRITEENFNDIQKLVHQIGDGHVRLVDTTSSLSSYESSLNFYPGSQLIKSCPACSPALPMGKYQILAINDHPFKDFIQINKLSVSASTPWGRDYRILETLAENSSKPKIQLTLKDSKNRLHSTNLNWKLKPILSPVCVSGERLKENVYKLNILSLWCEDPLQSNESRKRVFNRFTDQFDEQISKIKENDKIILDLRVNGGGADEEVEYVLNTFNSQSVFMYKYQFLKINQAVRFKWIHRLLQYKGNQWDEIVYMYTNLSLKTKFSLFNNKMITLISPGCFSSCEGLASSLKFSKRSEIIGEKSHGGAGSPELMSLPGVPYLINIPTCMSWQNDGNLFEGHGVLPTIPATQDLLKSGDNVLDQSLELLADN